jgi:hypothetical protein
MPSWTAVTKNEGAFRKDQGNSRTGWQDKDQPVNVYILAQKKIEIKTTKGNYWILSRSKVGKTKQRNPTRCHIHIWDDVNCGACTQIYDRTV